MFKRKTVNNNFRYFNRLSNQQQLPRIMGRQFTRMIRYFNRIIVQLEQTQAFFHHIIVLQCFIDHKQTNNIFLVLTKIIANVITKLSKYF